MRKTVWKKLRLTALAMTMLMLVMSMVGCGFSVGDVGGKESYKELFPDRAAELSSNYKTGDMGYDFSVGEYGKMKVYVDTSEGHSFELVKDSPAGFRINDANGETVLFAACLEREEYEMYTSGLSEVRTVNGRDFFYAQNSGDGSSDCFSYMADCGLDCGLVLETHEDDFSNFSLVAFRGEALEGASTSVYDYQGAGADTDYSDLDDYSDDNTDNGTEGALTGGVDSSYTNSTLSSETEGYLDALPTDYNKILWGSRYNMDADLPGLVFSVTPCETPGGHGLLIAITNLYDKDLSFSGNAQVVGPDDSIIGETFIYNTCVGRGGNTIVTVVDTGDVIPDGRVHWEDCQFGEATGKYVPWEADYQAKAGSLDGSIEVEYSLYTTSGDACVGDELVAVLVDESGFVTAVGTDYLSEIAANEKCTGTIFVWGDEDDIAATKSIALFANPYEQ